MEEGEFKFYKKLDSCGGDLQHCANKTVAELKELCKKTKACIAFNTLGFMKFNINETELKGVSYFKSDNDGLYVYTKRLNKNKKRNDIKYLINFEGYTFYNNKDSGGNDMNYLPNRSIEQLKEICDSDPNCAGFNTLGFMKSKINSEAEFINVNTKSYNAGLYVKNRKFRVKMLCNWCSSRDLCNEWNNMSKGNYTWNDIEITWEDKNIDFYVIINKPLAGETFVPERTIIFQMEPWCPNPNQNWGVKTWGEWAEPDESRFLQVRSHKKFYNNGFWQLGLTYNDLKTRRIEKTKLLSSICSSKYFDPGHIKRIDFLKYIEKKDDEIVKIDIYNTDNYHKFKGYVGPHPKNNKESGMMPYKYYYMPENNEEHNFITEKMWEPLITETLCFYWGCPNIAEYINPRAYILLDLNDYEKSFNIMKNAILNNEWEKRIEIIRMEKQKVLEYFNFFPTMERILKHDFKFNYKPSDDVITYHKYFSDIIGKNVKNICFLHSCTIKNNTTVLHEMKKIITDSKLMDSIDYLYIINLGNEISFQLPGQMAHKLRIINYSKNVNLFEKPTINLIHTFSQFHRDTKILYMHTKGISYDPPHTHITDWKNYLMYFLVENHKICMDLLDNYDSVGCNYHEKPLPHYSGNFWWANSNYIKGLNKITSNVRHDAEWWILNNNLAANKYVLYNTNVNHYEQPYPRNIYDNDKTREMINKFYKIDEKLRIKCVNLERRLDRKSSVSNLLKTHNLFEECDFYTAIDGTKLKPTDELKQLFSGNDFGSRRSFIGCALSHLNLWKQLKNDTMYDKYLILEDDIVFENNIKFKLANLQNTLQYKECDILFLGTTCYRSNKEIYNNKIKGIKSYLVTDLDTKLYIGGFFGYIITKSGVDKLLQFIEKNGIKHGIDYLPLKYGAEMELKCYEVLPHIIKSEYADGKHSVDSDIQYDHNKLF